MYKKKLEELLEVVEKYLKKKIPISMLRKVWRNIKEEVE